MASREQRVIETFVFLADSLATGFHADELLHLLADRCVEVLDVDAAGVMLAMKPEQLRAVAASSRNMRQLAVFEVAAAQGPSHDAYTSGEPVVEHDLSAAEIRWPRFAPRARQLGFVAAHGFPLRLRERTIGALNLFQTPAREPLSEADVLVAQGFADVAAMSLIQEEALYHTEQLVEQLEHALSTRVDIERAVGVIAERLSLPPRQAFEWLRKHARDRNIKVRDLAQDVLTGHVDGL